MRFQHIWLLAPVQADAVASSPLGFGSFTESTGLLDPHPLMTPTFSRELETQQGAMGCRYKAGTPQRNLGAECWY